MPGWRRALFILASAGALIHVREAEGQLPRAIEARSLAHFADTSITEASGVAASRHHPGLLWTIEDSGAEPVLHATDTTGADRGRWVVTGAENRDWEALATGPCPTGDCLFIGDIGDNTARRPSVTIYRVPEPDPRRPAHRTASAEQIRVTYPGGSRDAESLIALPDSTFLIISKTESGSRLFHVEAGRWNRQRAVVAEDLGILAVPSGSIARLVTDAALSPDQQHVAVRTYTAVYFFRLGEGGRLLPDKAGMGCGIFGIEPQGEGIAWLDAHVLVTASEDNFGMRGGLGLVRCPGQ